MELMTVSEVSKNFSISTRMLRYYEEVGLIESCRKENYAYRVYDDNAVKRLQNIIVLRKLRIPVKQIAIILDDYEQVQALSILRENIMELEEEITALSTIREILSVFVLHLDESVQMKVHLDLLENSELIDVVNALSLSKSNLREEHSMSDLNKAHESIQKLTDKEVRVIYIPPSKVAAIHCVSDLPEADCIGHLKKFITENQLDKIKPDFRVFGFNNDTQNAHGYEHWVTIPKDMEVKEPFVEKCICGGLYCAHMIPMGAFEEWKWLYEWVASSKEYDFDWRAPEHMMGGMLEEHLNYINIYQNSMEQLDKTMQLDLLIPIKKSGAIE